MESKETSGLNFLNEVNLKLSLRNKIDAFGDSKEKTFKKFQKIQDWAKQPSNF